MLFLDDDSQPILDQLSAKQSRNRSRPFRAGPSGAKGHTGAARCQLSRCSAGTNRVTCEGYRRQEQLCSDTVFIPDSPLGHISHNQQIPAACCPSAASVPVSSFTPHPPPPNTHSYHCGPRPVCAQGEAQFPRVSTATGTTIKRSILG